MLSTIRSLVQTPFFRYVLVGGLAFLVDFGLLHELTDHFGWPYLRSAAVGFVCGLIVNYILSVAWVFRERVVQDKRWEFLIFALIGLAGLGLTEGFMYVFVDKLGIPHLRAKLIVVVVVFMWNYYARKLILFSKLSKEKVL